MIYFYEDKKLRVIKIGNGDEVLDLVDDQNSLRRLLRDGGFKPTSAILTLVK